MSAKWRALQHRHRYTYNAVIFPQSYIDSLNSVQIQDQACAKFFTELAELVSLNSIYAQVNHVKKVTSAFSVLSCNANEALISVASKLYLEVLFLENSLPLHRTLVSGLLKIRNFHSEIGACFRKLCQDYGVVQHGKGKRFCVCRVALSIMGMPKLGYLVDVVEECAILVTRDVVFSLNSVVSETNESARPSPIVMEQCQESLSCLYYLLQRFPKSFQDSKSSGDSLIEQDSNVLEVIFPVLLSVLKSSSFSRDCFVAAGVSFCAALQVCLSSQDLGLVVIEGIFCQTIHSSLTNFNSSICDIVAKVPYKGDLCSEICDFSSLSRLCLIRGILTTFSRAVLNFQHVVSAGSNSVKTILYDGILPELCNYCDNPTDSHFNFHSLTVMQICLQQIKTSMQANISDLSSSYEPLPEDMGGRMLRLIWNNLEDPLSQTVKQVHLIFDLFLDIRSTLYWSEGEKIKAFLQNIATDLLRLGPRCKGRYVPLASLTKRLGAKTMLCMNSELLFETMQAYIDDDVCCAATSFLKCFLEHLRDECWSSDGIENGYAVYRGYCLPPILYGLGSGVSKLRSNLNTYALPVLLEIDLDSIFPMLAFISVGPKGVENELLHSEFNPGRMELRNEQKVAILVSLLKVSRFLVLMEGDVDWSEDPTIKHKNGVTEAACVRYARVCIKGVEVEILVEWLVMALTHVDESLRVDAAETLFLNPKTSSLPSHLEVTLLKEAVPLNMRCCSTAFQMKWNSLFRKLFSRVRTALERQLKQGNWRPLSYIESHEESLLTRSEETLDSRANDLFLFMRWLGGFLFLSCYPSAPYQRKIMSMELILIMFSVWPDMPSFQEDFGSFSPETYLCPYNKGIASPHLTLLLVGSIVDSWDRLRENSVRILLHFPTPLPGISSEAMVCKLVTWAKILVCSQRVRESDAGALTLRLIFRKYVLKLGWTIRASVNVVCFPSHSATANESDEIHRYKQPMLEYLKSLIDWLEVVVEKGEKDLSEACNKSFVHGVLLTLRYTFEEIDWNSDVTLSSVSEMRNLLEKLLELVMRITLLALWVVSADAWYLQDDMEDIIDGDNFSMDIPTVVELSNPSPAVDEKRSNPIYDTRASEQIVMVGCWLAMKEVSLLLGTIIRKIPLPDASFSDSLGSVDIFSDALQNNEVLDLKQLQTIGNHFLDVLLKMKHNGAIDKTRAGFTALCNRLLCSNNPRLCRLTEYWMEQLMERTVAKGQIVDNLLRRSAGIPAAFTALFLSEPEGAPKKLLPWALRWLIDVAKRSIMDPVETDNGNGDLVETESERANQYPKPSLPLETNTNEKASKIRDEGVIPTVHAFNVLRAAFNDTNLAADTSGFSAEALIVSISAFSSPYWEVRNSACQAYTALVRRMIGFLNVQKRESARRALSGLEFFHRYPSLHLFLFNELKVATVLLEDGSSKGQQLNLKSIVHPSLCPVLILLSRLKPSTIASESNDELDPFLFVPFIRRCSTQSNLRVRLLASRALTGLVSNEKLPSVLLKIVSQLPIDDAHRTAGNSFNWMHGTLLQLHSLLDTNCKNLADFLKKDHILTDLLQVMKKCTWIANPKQCPCPVLNVSFIQMLDHMLSISRTCPESKSLTITRDLVLNLTTKSLNLEASSGLLAFDPTTIDLRKQAAISYFNCVFQRSKEEADDIPKFSPTSLLNKESSETPVTDHLFPGLQENLISSLQDSSYEVRLVTLKWLLNFLKSTKSVYKSSVHEIMTIQNWCETDLQVTLSRLLTEETNHRCVHYILRTIFTWNLLQFQNFDRKKCSDIVFVGQMDIDLVFQFWNQLVSLHDRARHLKTRETIICCMGVCMKRIVGLFSSAILCRTGKMISTEYTSSDQIERLYAYMTQYANLLKKNSKYTEPVTMRKAAAESIMVSGLLEEADIIGSSVSNNKIPSKTPQSHLEPNEMVNAYARLLLDMWFTCLRLLEDEDDEIRQKLAIDVQKCFVSKSSSGSSHIPFQVEKVIASSFDHLSSIFGHWIEYSHFLSDWVLEGANFTISQGDLVRRVFDKEIDNHHEERLLIIQICCFHLEKILKTHMADSGDEKWFKEYVYNRRMRFCRKLISFAEEYVCRNGEDDWIGGVGNHKDAFLPIYANLLGFYAFSCSLFEENEEDLPLPLELVEVGNVISPFLTNPLIFNLYMLLLRKLEKTGVVKATCSVSISIESNSFWEDFNPYFLIR